MPKKLVQYYKDQYKLERKSKTDPHGLPMWFLRLGRVIKCLIELHFRSYKHVFHIFTSFVGYDRRSLKIVFRRGWYFIRVQFAINVFLRSCTTGWYVVTKGNSLSLLFCFCFSTDCLWSKVTSDKDLSISCLGYPRTSSRLKFARHSSNVFFEEFVLSNLIASPLMKPLFTPGGWHEVRCVYWKVSVGS